MRKLSDLHEAHYSFLSKAPERFTRKEAVSICESLGFKSRWFDVALRKQNFASLFVRENYGVYRKA